MKKALRTALLSIVLFALPTTLPASAAAKASLSPATALWASLVRVTMTLVAHEESRSDGSDVQPQDQEAPDLRRGSR
jgi:hypothetical protein